MMKNFEFRISNFGFGAVLVAFVVSISVDLSAQTIADAARKERERQSHVRSKAVYTNGVAIPAPSASPASKAPSDTTAAPAKKPEGAPAPTGPTDNKGRDEKYWRAAFQKARDDVKRADDKVVLLDLKIKDLNTQLLRQSDIYNREYRIGPEITAAQAELDAARKQAEQAKQRIADLEEELRRSAGLPGWAR
jgi:type IV secretory pathway VirB10-like protein